MWEVIGGVHVFMMAYLAMLCYTGRRFLLDDMFYLRVRIIGGHVIQFEWFHWHILLDDLSYRRAPLI